MQKTTLFKKLNKEFPLFILLFLAAFLRIWLSSGVGGSDEVVYIIEAYKFISGTYEAPTYIAQLRIGTILPIALMFKLFGVNSYTIFMWPLIASLINIVVIYLISFQLLGRRPALLAALCGAFFPLDIYMGGRAMTETPLTLMLSLSVLFYLSAFKNEYQYKKMVFYLLAGFFVGLAALNKHPAILIFFFFIVHSVLNKNSILNLLYVLAGGFLVLIFEVTYLYFVTGDPLFLYHIFTRFTDPTSEGNIVRGKLPCTYYLYYMLVSLQHVGLYFYLALSGIFYFFFRRKQIAQNDVAGINFLLVWGLSMMGIMTFLPIGFSPLIFIPKQTNYIMMFSVPFVILSGYSLSLIPKNGFIYASIAILCSTSIFCACFQRNTIKSHSYNTEAAFQYIAKYPEAILITGEFNTHYCMIYNILHKQKIEYRFFDEIIRGKIDKARYGYQRRLGDDQQLMDAIKTYDKALVLYDVRIAQRQGQRDKYYYPALSIFQNTESDFRLLATIKREKNNIERFLEPILTSFARIIENYGSGNIAKKIRSQIKDVFNPEPAYIFIKE